MTNSMGGQAAGLLCPLCRVSLVMSERQGVEIDYCPQCRGVWLDRGELDKILERSAAELAPPASPPPTSQAPYPERGHAPSPDYRRDHDRDRDRYDDYKHHKHHKRRSFLHDLFD
jgi:hypothetical protein